MLATMPSIPPDLAQQIVAVLPGAALERAVLIGEGWNAAAWRIPATNGDWVVRIPLVEYAKGEIERQTCLAPELAARGFPVPGDWSILRDEAGGVAAGVYRFVDGVPASRSGRARARSLAEQLSDLVTRLHAVPLEVPLACGAERLQVWPRFYIDLIDGWRQALGPRTQAWLVGVREELDAAGSSLAPEVFIHADLAPWHLVCDERGGIVAVLDFLGPRFGDPALDFGRLVQHWGLGFADAVLAGYRGHVDSGFRQRMRIYGQLEALATIRAATARDIPAWVAWGRRKLAATAVAQSRRT